MGVDPAFLWRGYRSGAATFENPAASRGSGGTAAGGRKGAPFRILRPGERVVLAALDGPGTVTHLWATFDTPTLDASPTTLRSQVLEVFYDGLEEPSVSVPAPDFFGVVHGLPAPYASTLSAVNEGRGYASRIPMPFRQHIRMEWWNAASQAVILYYQADVLFGVVERDNGILHASFRRENPTVPQQDFLITEWAHGPGRFLGCTGGVRVLDSEHWWGEGEVKIYLDGDDSLPTICGTGTEDYLDSAWGVGTFHAPETGAPLVLAAEGKPHSFHQYVGWYRWHLSDPIVFDRALRVTIQQIGSALFGPEDQSAYRSFRDAVPVAGNGWFETMTTQGPLAFGLFERSDDWCATAFVYGDEPHPVSRVDLQSACADLAADRIGLREVHRA